MFKTTETNFIQYLLNILIIFFIFPSFSLSQTKNIPLESNRENFKRSVLVISHEKIFNDTNLGKAIFAKFKNEEKAFFGLPGNSISSAACFRFFVYPYLKYSLGISLEEPFKANLKNGLIKNKKFTRFMKSRINTTKNGKVEVKILSGQESFRVKSFVNSNVWTVLPSGKAKFKKKDIVDCYFLNQPNNIFI